MMLPPPAELERICKGLATLDAILSEDWELRFFSFNATWDASRGERMASMRNGEGDAWFLVFTGGYVFFKAFWHEHRRGVPDEVYDGLPAALERQRQAPASSMDDVTFGGWYDPERGWTMRGAYEPFAEEWAILTGATDVVIAYAASCLSVDVPRDAVEHVLAGKPLDEAVVARIAAGRTLESLQADLDEIVY